LSKKNKKEASSLKGREDDGLVRIKRNVPQVRQEAPNQDVGEKRFGGGRTVGSPDRGGELRRKPCGGGRARGGNHTGPKER